MIGLEKWRPKSTGHDSVRRFCLHIDPESWQKLQPRLRERRRFGGHPDSRPGEDRDTIPPMGETRVDLQHLLEDLRDAYTGSLEETILTEILANALDSGASRILLMINAPEATLTVIDDGRGMQRRQLARYTTWPPAPRRAVRGSGLRASGSSSGSWWRARSSPRRGAVRRTWPRAGISSRATAPVEVDSATRTHRRARHGRAALAGEPAVVASLNAGTSSRNRPLGIAPWMKISPHSFLPAGQTSRRGRLQVDARVPPGCPARQAVPEFGRAPAHAVGG